MHKVTFADEWKLQNLRNALTWQFHNIYNHLLPSYFIIHFSIMSDSLMSLQCKPLDFTAHNRLTISTNMLHQMMLAERCVRMKCALQRSVKLQDAAGRKLSSLGGDVREKGKINIDLVFHSFSISSVMLC